MKVEISCSEYLKLLLDTAPEHQDLYWCLRTKLQLKKMQHMSGYDLKETAREVDSVYEDIMKHDSILDDYPINT